MKPKQVTFSCPFCGTAVHEGEVCPKCKVGLPYGSSQAITRVRTRIHLGDRRREGGVSGTHSLAF